MLAHCKQIMEYNSGTVEIHPKFNKLNTALRTAVENGEDVLDKEATSNADLFDAFRMSRRSRSIVTNSKIPYKKEGQ